MAGAAHVIIIGDWSDDESRSLRIQDFERDGRSFIPVFTSERAFDDQTKGSPFAGKGISIDLEMLLAMMKGDETLVLNPGGEAPWVLSAQPATRSA